MNLLLREIWHSPEHHHLQEFTQASARLHAGPLFLATIALLILSAISQAGADTYERAISA